MQGRVHHVEVGMTSHQREPTARRTRRTEAGIGATFVVRPSEADADLQISPKAVAPSDIPVLFDQYSRLVLNAARRILSDPIEAEDIVQEVFLYLHRKAKLFDSSRGSVKTWILRIAVSRAIDRKIYLSRHGFYSEVGLDFIATAQVGDIEEQIQTRLTREHIERAFSELPYMQRRTLQSFYFDGLELRDISEQLRQPLGSVRHYLYRGLERLRKNSSLHTLRS